MEAIIEPVGQDRRAADNQPSTAPVGDRGRAEFVTVYTSQYPRLLGFVWRRTGSRQVAEDVTAEVFRIAWERIEEGAPTPGWLFVTARNLVMAHHRATRRGESMRKRLAEEAMADRPGTGDGSDAVRVALEQLQPRQRELLMAFYWDGLTGAECAALAGCSVGAVWVRLHRARSALRGELDQRGRS